MVIGISNNIYLNMRHTKLKQQSSYSNLMDGNCISRTSHSQHSAPFPPSLLPFKRFLPIFSHILSPHLSLPPLSHPSLTLYLHSPTKPLCRNTATSHTHYTKNLSPEAAAQAHLICMFQYSAIL